MKRLAAGPCAAGPRKLGRPCRGGPSRSEKSNWISPRVSWAGATRSLRPSCSRNCTPAGGWTTLMRSRRV